MIKTSNIASILGLSPLTAVIGFIIFIAFFSNVPNLIDVNHLELALMDNKHKFFRYIIRFNMMFMVILLSIFFLKDGFLWVPKWLNNGISIVSGLILLITLTLKSIYTFKGDMPQKIADLIENKRNYIAIAVITLLFISIATHSGYVFENADKIVDVETGRTLFSRETVVGFTYLYLCFYQTIWFTLIVSLMNYKMKKIIMKLKNDSEEYIVKKVLFNGMIDMKHTTSDVRVPVSEDDIRNKEYRIE